MFLHVSPIFADTGASNHVKRMTELRSWSERGIQRRGFRRFWPAMGRGGIKHIRPWLNIKMNFHCPIWIIETHSTRFWMLWGITMLASFCHVQSQQMWFAFTKQWQFQPDLFFLIEVREARSAWGAPLPNTWAGTKIKSNSFAHGIEGRRNLSAICTFSN